MLRFNLAIILSLYWGAGIHAQQATPPGQLADALCNCLGSIDPAADNRSFDLAVRQCLNTTMREHSGEVIELMRRFPVQDRRYYILGLVLGSSLDKACPQYPLIRDRLRSTVDATTDAPNT
ncbi:MAG: hypothetical protein JST45_11830 [Bacteroidetes bacterium]|nr:hypothetical protein [Bacteroidota bacterium]